MELYLYGVMAGNKPRDFGSGIRTIPVGDLAAVVGPAPKDNFHQLPREELLQLLLTHQKTQEEIMKDTFLLPFKFGTVLLSPVEIQRLLGDHGPFLAQLIERWAGCCEINVVVAWDVNQVLNEIAVVDPKIREAKEQATIDPSQQVAVGVLLAKGLKERALKRRQEISRALVPTVMRSMEHELLNDSMVLNQSFLLKSEREAEFFETILKIDRHYEDKLHFKCVGPLPLYSFATLIVQRFDPDRVREAAKLLGLNGVAELAQVKKNYKRLSRECHPDTHPDQTTDAFERLNEAYRLLADYCQDGPRFLEHQAIAGFLGLTVQEAGGGQNHAA